MTQTPSALSEIELAPVIAAAPRVSSAAGSDLRLSCRDLPRRPLQRTTDLTLAAGLLVVAVPIMLAAAAAVYIEDGGPIFFVQPRLGRNGRLFGCFKLRSMALDAEDMLEQILIENGPAR